MFEFLKKIRSFFKKKSTGVAILETALTLPIVLYIVFFAIELVRIGLAQAAVDAITKECTFSLMAKGNVNDFDNIFQKYRPLGIPIGYFRYYIRVYQNFHTNDNKGVMDLTPYGGESIAWIGADYANPTANASPTATSRGGSGGGAFGTATTTPGNKSATLSKYQTVFCYDSKTGEVGAAKRKQVVDGEISNSGYIFVLTVAVKFPFSSALVAKLFNGGKNTDKSGVYILWARGSGIIN